MRPYSSPMPGITCKAEVASRFELHRSLKQLYVRVNRRYSDIRLNYCVFGECRSEVVASNGLPEWRRYCRSWSRGMPKTRHAPYIARNDIDAAMRRFTPLLLRISLPTAICHSV